MIKLAAYHESGHIALAYFFGYSCDYTALSLSEPGTGESRMNYGSDLYIITSIINYFDDPTMFHEHTSSLQERSLAVADCFASIMIAGAAAEIISTLDHQFKGLANVEIGGPDLERIQNIDYFLFQKDPNHNLNYIQSKITHTVSLIKSNQIWRAVDILAINLFMQEDKKLSKPGIENNLQMCGYLEYCNSSK